MVVVVVLVVSQPGPGYVSLLVMLVMLAVGCWPLAVWNPFSACVCVCFVLPGAKALSVAD